MIFAKFAQIQTHSFKIMASHVSEEVVSSAVNSSYTLLQSSTTEELTKQLRKLKKYGVEEEAKELQRFLRGINEGESIREYFYDAIHLCM